MAGKKAFDTDTAEEAAMLVFWERGYADASLDTLGDAMAVGRSSFYNAFGGKEALFKRSLIRYGTRYGDQYQQALAAHRDDLGAALRAFFDVTLTRIADPAVPRGCLIAQSVMATPSLPASGAVEAGRLLDMQRQRIAAAIVSGGSDAAVADEVALQLAAVNQSLAVLSRTALPEDQLGSIADAAVTAAIGSL
jgi:AcrR family transcriptional regulator